MTTQFKRPPIFDLYTVNELSKRLGRTKRYLCDLEEGTKPIGPHFVHLACAILGRSEAELFGPQEDAQEPTETSNA